MVKVALIGCTSRKMKTPCEAKKMYSASAYFKYKLEYCKKINVDEIYILSSKYGLLELDDIIEPYDCYLKKQTIEYKNEWNEIILNELKDKTDINNDEFILLAGRAYVDDLKKSLNNTYNPVEGLGYGDQLKYFKEYEEEHTLLNASDLRNKEELQNMPNKAGYYKWWSNKKDLNIILKKLNVNFDDIKDYIETKNNLYSIYVGIAVKESVRSRINWHVNDKHTKSRVENGTLSTLRQSISSIVAENQYDKNETDKFIDKLKIEYFTTDYPIKSLEAKNELEEIEKELMNTNLYVLNLQNNHHPQAKAIKKELKQLRKISKNKDTDNSQLKTILASIDKRNYEEFNKMLEIMKEMDYDYSINESFLHIPDRKNKELPLENHISALVYSQLSANRPWKGIEENKEKINKIFNNFDPEYLKKVNPEKLENEIKNIKCGNRLIHIQMLGLKDNILMFEKIEKEYGSLDNFVTSDEAINIAKKLSKGKYKLKGVGLALACEYLKGVGIDCIKPDIHICRILGRFGYSKKEMATENEAIKIIDEISKEYHLPKMEIDTILWQYCADGYLEICGSNPKCHICKIKCKYSKNILSNK